LAHNDEPGKLRVIFPQLKCNCMSGKELYHKNEECHENNEHGKYF